MIQTNMGAFDASAGFSLGGGATSGNDYITVTTTPLQSIVQKYSRTFQTSTRGTALLKPAATLQKASPFRPGGNSLPGDQEYPGPVEQMITLPATLANNIGAKTGLPVPLVLAGVLVLALGGAYVATR